MKTPLSHFLIKLALLLKDVPKYEDQVKAMSRPEDFKALVDLIDDPNLKGYLQNKYGDELKYIDKNFNLLKPSRLGEIKKALLDFIPVMIKDKTWKPFHTRAR